MIWLCLNNENNFLDEIDFKENEKQKLNTILWIQYLRRAGAIGSGPLFCFCHQYCRDKIVLFWPCFWKEKGCFWPVLYILGFPHTYAINATFWKTSVFSDLLLQQLRLQILGAQKTINVRLFWISNLHNSGCFFESVQTFNFKSSKWLLMVLEYNSPS